MCSSPTVTRAAATWWSIGADDDGEPVAWMAVNAYGEMHRSERLPLALGGHDLVVTLRALPGFRWHLELTDGVGTTTLADVPQLLGMAPFTGISVGADRGGPVDWELTEEPRQPPVLRSARPRAVRPRPVHTRRPAERARVWAEGASIYD